MQTVLDQALDAYQRERFFAALDQAYEALWADPEVRDEEAETPDACAGEPARRRRARFEFHQGRGPALPLKGAAGGGAMG
jgi:hypothetical protein